MTPRQILVVCIGSVLLLGGGYLGKQALSGMKEEPPKFGQKENVRTVEAIPVKYKETETELQVFGRLGSAQPVDVMAEVSGKILPGSIPLKKGQNFSTGQVLIRIDKTEADLNLLSQKSNFLKTLAGILPDMKIDFADRFQTWQDFFNSLNVEESFPELPEGQSSREKTFLASRGILSEYYSIRSAEERLQKYTLAAPYTGSFSDVFLEVGSIANPGTRIARIIRTNKLEMEAPIRSEDVKWVKKGTKVKVRSEDGQHEWDGVIARVGDRVDPATQSVTLFITVFSNSEAKLYEGLYLDATIPGKVLKKSMEIPRKAVFNRNEVYVVEDGRLRKKKIQVLKINPATVFFSGIEEGTMLLTDPPVNALENMKVKVAAP